MRHRVAQPREQLTAVIGDVAIAQRDHFAPGASGAALGDNGGHRRGLELRVERGQDESDRQHL